MEGITFLSFLKNHVEVLPNCVTISYKNLSVFPG